MTREKTSVFVLGLGSIGALLASYIQMGSDTRIIPLLRSVETLRKFKDGGSKIIMKRVFQDNLVPLNTKFEDSYCPQTFPKDMKIRNLIVTTKTFQTKEALLPYVKHMDTSSNIIFVQNGLGVLEILKSEVFTEFAPQIFQGVIAHGISPEKDYVYRHTGNADLKIARLPIKEVEDMIQEKTLLENDRMLCDLIRVFSEKEVAENLCIKHMTYQELLLVQIQKFLVNSCINPITAIFDCCNGELETVARPIFESIIDESLKVLREEYKPFFVYKSSDSRFPKVDFEEALTPEKLIEFIIAVGCVKNYETSSSMREDLVHLRDTEIDYINGYIVHLCAKLGLPEECCKINKGILLLVNAKLNLNRFQARK